MTGRSPEESVRGSWRPRRIAFAGSPAEAAVVLRRLVAERFQVPLVVTGSPKRRQRRGNATPTAVEVVAREFGLNVSYEPNHLATVSADCGVVVAYGRLLGPEVLNQLPMLNLHFSLLPRWRGAAPVERALLAGDSKTGVCLMRVEPQLDTGPLYWSLELPAVPRETASERRMWMARMGAVRLVLSLIEGLGEPVPQRGDATYAKKVTRDDLRVGWPLTAAIIDRQVRVGGAWTTIDGTELKVIDATPLQPIGGFKGEPPGLLVNDLVTAGAESSPDAPYRLPAWVTEGWQPLRDLSSEDLVAAVRLRENLTMLEASRAIRPAARDWAKSGPIVVCGDGALRLEVVQVAGRKAVAADAWLRGARLQPGSTLGT